MRNITYKGITGRYELCNDDNGRASYYAGSIPGIADAVILFEGETKEEMVQDFRDAVDDCIARGYTQVMPTTHRITISFELYNSLRKRAASAGVSVSAYAQKALSSVVL